MPTHCRHCGLQSPGLIPDRTAQFIKKKKKKKVEIGPLGISEDVCIDVCRKVATKKGRNTRSHGLFCLLQICRLLGSPLIDFANIIATSDFFVGLTVGNATYISVKGNNNLR